QRPRLFAGAAGAGDGARVLRRGHASGHSGAAAGGRGRLVHAAEPDADGAERLLPAGRAGLGDPLALAGTGGCGGIPARAGRRGGGMSDFLTLLLRAAFVENMPLTLFLGLCTFLALSRRPETAIGLGLAVMAVMTVTVPLNQFVYTAFLAPGAWAWA